MTIFSASNLEFKNRAVAIASSWIVRSLGRSMLGKNAANKPTAGRYEQTRYTKLMLVKSASQPRTAAPASASNANPKQRPGDHSALPGQAPCAKTTMTKML